MLSGDLKTDLGDFPQSSRVYILPDCVLMHHPSLPKHDGVKSILLEELKLADLNVHLTYRESETFYELGAGAEAERGRPTPLMKRFSVTQTPAHVPGFGFEHINSLGGVWSRLSTSLFGHWNYCGKVMGLVGYADGNIDPGPPLVEGSMHDPTNVLAINRKELSGEPMQESLSGQFDFTFPEKLGEPVPKSSTSLSAAYSRVKAKLNPLVSKSISLSRSLQSNTNDIVLSTLKYLKAHAPSRTLICTGGVHQNALLNSHIYSSGVFENVYVSPWPGDEGTSIGCAMYSAMEAERCASNGDCSIKIKIDDATVPFFGGGYSSEEVDDALKGYAEFVDSEVPPREALPELVSSRVAAGDVVALFSGRSEVGARALGHRSIIADPRIPSTHFMNKQVKSRESFRPISPSVLSEHVSEWFHNGPGVQDCSPYMGMTLNVKQDKASLIPGVTHVDGSARLQTVSPKRPGLWRDIILAFHKLTGVPMIINTSFNTIKGEPIVESPSDAMKSFVHSRGGLDALVMEGRIVTRRSIGGAVTGEGVWARIGDFAADTREAYVGESDGGDVRGCDVRIDRHGSTEKHAFDERLIVEVLGLCNGENSVADMVDILGDDEIALGDVAERIEKLHSLMLVHKLN
jgi:carbamoyltransferase